MRAAALAGDPRCSAGTTASWWGELMTDNAIRWAVLAQAMLAFYFQLVQWVPLGRWNHEPEDLGPNPLSNLPLLSMAAKGTLTTGAVLLVMAFLLPFILFWVGYRRRSRLLMWLQVPFYAGWLAIQMTWWVLYAIGRTDEQVDRYQRVFGHSTQLLPSFGRHLPPDGAHLVLHVLLVVALLTTVAALRAGRTPGPVMA